MPLYEKFDRYHAEAQHGQKITLHDPDETIQSKLPVDDGELILTQTRLYLCRTGRKGKVPNVRLERARPKVHPEDEYLEIAPRMGVFLTPGQTGAPFLGMVEEMRRLALERAEQAAMETRDGILRRYDALLVNASREGLDRPKRKATLRNLHQADPARPEAATRLGELYLEEGNFRAATLWLIRAGVFDDRFDRALERVRRPRLPSREEPPPEWWIDRHLTPLLQQPAGEGPNAIQRQRIRAARGRIGEFREASGRISVMTGLMFSATLAGWIFLLILRPWLTLGITAGAAMAIGLTTLLRARGRRPPKR
jgi:hypothetical protein